MVSHSFGFLPSPFLPVVTCAQALVPNPHSKRPLVRVTSASQQVLHKNNSLFVVGLSRRPDKDVRVSVLPSGHGRAIGRWCVPGCRDVVQAPRVEAAGGAEGLRAAEVGRRCEGSAGVVSGLQEGSRCIARSLEASVVLPQYGFQESYSPCVLESLACTPHAFIHSRDMGIERGLQVAVASPFSALQILSFGFVSFSKK